VFLPPLYIDAMGTFILIGLVIAVLFFLYKAIVMAGAEIAGGYVKAWLILLGVFVGAAVLGSACSFLLDY